MKKLKRLLALVLCLMLVQVPVLAVSQPTEVHAATQNGLVYNKTTEKYYYYADGKKITNKWKTVNGYKYYFGKNGAAYAAEVIPGYKYNIVCKKIDGKYYGFDNKGHMVKGLNVSVSGKVYYFSTKTGVYSPSVTSKYRKAAKYETDAANLRKLLGNPKKTETSNSCYKLNGTDVLLKYGRYEVVLFRDNATKKEIVLGISPM